MLEVGLTEWVCDTFPLALGVCRKLVAMMHSVHQPGVKIIHSLTLVNDDPTPHQACLSPHYLCIVPCTWGQPG